MAGFKWLVAVTAIIVLVMIGTRRSYPRSNVSKVYKLHLETKKPAFYKIEVQTAPKLAFDVSTNGDVAVEVPKLLGSCSYDWFCFTVVDGSPITRPLIWIVGDNHVIKRYSVAQLERMPRDSEGTIHIKL